MLPDYITEDPYLNKIPTKDELTDRINEEKITKDILFVIAYSIAVCKKSGLSSTRVKVSTLKNLGYEPYKHESIVIEFFKNKGYTVVVDDDGFEFQID